MTQQDRNKIFNISIIISILATIIGLVIFCLFSTNDNMFCIITATSNNKTQANVLVSEYKETSTQKQTFLTTAKPKDSLWTGLINKASKTQQEKQSAKPIIIKSNSTYYAYHITIKNQDNKVLSYNLSIQNLNQEQFVVLYGYWDKSGFSTNNTLSSGTIDPNKNLDCYVIITSKSSTPVKQDKKININISTDLLK